MNEIITELNAVVAFFEAHKAMDAVIAAWLVRDWKSLCSAYPFIVAQGGIGFIVRKFFWNPPVTPAAAPIPLAVPVKPATTTTT